MGISLKDIFSLENMLTPKFIQFIYKIGLVGILLIGLSQLFKGQFISGLMTIILGFIAIRVVSEMVIVYFKSNKVEVSMEDIDYSGLEEKFKKAKKSAESKFTKVKGVAEDKLKSDQSTTTKSS